jgi:hypothetical protein
MDLHIVYMAIDTYMHNIGTYYYLSKIIRMKNVATHKPIVIQINLESMLIKNLHSQLITYSLDF